jgi:hypothetical protein
MVWTMTNVTKGELMGSDATSWPSTAWYKLSDVSSSSLVATFGTNSNPYVFFPGFAASSNQDLWVDATNGSDAVWFRGHPEAPLRTFIHAVDVSTVNDVIHLAAGTYAGGSTLKAGTKLIGAGRYVSRIAEGAPNSIFVKSNNITLENFSTGIIRIGTSGGAGVTNLMLDNLEVSGPAGGDALFVEGRYRNLHGVNCTFSSGWDCWADYQTTGGWDDDFTNSTAVFDNCIFWNDSGLGTGGAEAIVLGPGQFRMHGGYIRTRQNVAAVIGCVQTVNAKGTNGIASFVGVNFDCVNTNVSGSAYSVYDALGARVSLVGCTFSPLNIYDPSNHVTLRSEGLVANLLVQSNALATIPTLGKGDAYLWSSNGVLYSINSNPGGTLTTNKLAP